LRSAISAGGCQVGHSCFHIGFALPGKALLADADAVADSLAAAQHVVEEAVLGVDDDRPALLHRLVGNDLAVELGVEALDRDRRQCVAGIRDFAIRIGEDLGSFDSGWVSRGRGRGGAGGHAQAEHDAECRDKCADAHLILLYSWERAAPREPPVRHGYV
jgi:hypothetical protein